MKYIWFLALLCLHGSSVYGQSYFPERNAIWESVSPLEYDIDTSLLNKAIEFAKNSDYKGSTDLRQAIFKGFEREPFHQLLGPTKKRGGPTGMILKDGKIIASWGDTRRVDMTFSVTKSYLSTIAGLAEDHRLIADIHDKVGAYVWDGKFDGAHNSKITWDHLLTQSSDWSGQLWGGYDWADRPPKEGGIDDWKFRKLNEPGDVFEYNDVRVNLLSYSLMNIWRKPLPQILKEYIMDPIGASTTWRWYGYDNSWVNIDGQKMQSVSGGGHSGGGLFISTEDHARFGLLFLNNGNWNGTQLISQDWINKAIAPSKANSSYGYMWWLNPNDPEDRMSNVSSTGYYAAGFGGNYIIVEPDHNMVIVARWLEPSKANEFMGILKNALK